MVLRYSELEDENAQLNLDISRLKRKLEKSKKKTSHQAEQLEAKEKEWEQEKRQTFREVSFHTSFPLCLGFF